MRLYSYIGPEEIRAASQDKGSGTQIRTAADAVSWLQDHSDQEDERGFIWATYVVDPQGVLRLADRHSEHVACAGGGQVLAAGEIAFSLSSSGTEIEEISNLSTGYCPEPDCWTAVQQAISRTGLDHPDSFSSAIIFRKCPSCNQRNVVKDDWFYCGVCEEELPSQWNF